MTTKKQSTRGKPMNLYMRAEDVAKMRELTAYAASNGLRTSDSMVVRAALRATAASRRFLSALRGAESSDLRFKR